MPHPLQSLRNFSPRRLRRMGSLPSLGALSKDQFLELDDLHDQLHVAVEKLAVLTLHLPTSMLYCRPSPGYEQNYQKFSPKTPKDSPRSLYSKVAALLQAPRRRKNGGRSVGCIQTFRWQTCCIVISSSCEYSPYYGFRTLSPCR